jgi:ornithine carbamoyltransferase
MKKDLLSVGDLSMEEIQLVFRNTDEIRKDPEKHSDVLKGKSIALIFERPSTRTRVSFDVGISQMGGHPVYMNWNDMQLSRGESIKDTAKTLERYCDGIVARVSSHRTLAELAANSRVPVINALSDLEHPCQAIADLYTIREKRKGFKGLKLACVGDCGTNVAHSLLLLCTRLGIDIYMACPERYQPKKEILKAAGKSSDKTMSKLKVVENVKQAVTNADIVYTDSWVSMGKESEKSGRLRELKPYQINRDILKLAGKDCLVMHCLPAHRGQEITDEVMDGPNFAGFDQAGNRLHVQKALLEMLLIEPRKPKFRFLAE